MKLASDKVQKITYWLSSDKSWGPMSRQCKSHWQAIFCNVNFPQLQICCSPKASQQERLHHIFMAVFWRKPTKRCLGWKCLPSLKDRITSYNSFQSSKDTLPYQLYQFNIVWMAYITLLLQESQNIHLDLKLLVRDQLHTEKLILETEKHVLMHNVYYEAVLKWRTSFTDHLCLNSGGTSYT